MLHNILSNFAKAMHYKVTTRTPKEKCSRISNSKSHCRTVR